MGTVHNRRGRISAVIACAVALGATAVLAFSERDLRRAIHEGESGLVLLAGLVSLVGSVWLAVRTVRGRETAAAWWIAPLALPQIAALAAFARSGRTLDRALDGVVGEIVPRIVAEGMGEGMSAGTLADLLTTACAATIALTLAGAGDGVRPNAKTILVAGGAWAAAAIVLFVLGARRDGAFSSLSLLSPILVFAMVAVAVVSRGARDRSAIMALSAIVAVCLVERAIADRAGSTALLTAGFEDFPTEMRASVLAAYLGVRTHARVAMIVHVALGSATFLAANGLPKKNLAALVGAVVAVLAPAAFHRHELARRLDAARHAFDLEVPIPTANVRRGWSVDSARVVVKRDGTMKEITPSAEIEEKAPDEGADQQDQHPHARPRSTLTVFADKDVSCAALVAALTPRVRSKQSFTLATVTAPDDEEPKPFIGDFEVLASARALVGLGFNLGSYEPIAKAKLEGGLLTVKIADEPPLAFALGANPDVVAFAILARQPKPLSRRQTVELTVRATDSAQALASALGLLTAAFPMPETGQKRYFALQVEP